MKLNLMGGSYVARSPVASAQRCLNLIAEPLPQDEDEPARMVYHQTPGLRTLATLPTGPVRAIRQVTTGAVYAVGGNVVYALDANWNPTALGSITSGLTTPVSLCDNGLQLVIVDGSANGWTVTLATNAFAEIADPTGSFRGGDRVDFLDTFFLFNVPGTPQFESSLSLSTTFDPLYFANKESYSDLLVALIVAKLEIWLIGTRSTEVWYNAGAPDFPFQRMTGVFIDHGCAAKYSVAGIDNAVFWLGQDRFGQGIAYKGAGSDAERISTFAIEAALAGYATIADAVGWTYSLAGHSFYVLSFPAADKTWVFDIATRLWHEWCWLDGDGVEHRHRANCCFNCNGIVAVGDWQSGNLYALDNAAFDDAGAPIKRLRVFPHIEGDDGQRMFFRDFSANMSTGGALANTTDATQPVVYLSYSDDRGVSWSDPLPSGLGASGAYRTQPQWNRLGMARGRVFALEWSVPADIALLGAWVDVAPGQS